MWCVAGRYEQLLSEVVAVRDDLRALVVYLPKDGCTHSHANVMCATILLSNKPPYCRLSIDNQSKYYMGITMGITCTHSEHIPYSNAYITGRDWLD